MNLWIKKLQDVYKRQGMRITIDTNSKNIKKIPFEVLFEDDHLIVVNKPSGLLTICLLYTSRCV